MTLGVPDETAAPEAGAPGEATEPRLVVPLGGEQQKTQPLERCSFGSRRLRMAVTRRCCMCFGSYRVRWSGKNPDLLTSNTSKHD